MLKTDKYNNVPDGLIPKLGYNEIAHFRSLQNGRDPHGNPTYPQYVLPSTSTIYVDGKFVEIAFVTNVAPDGKKAQLGEISFETASKGVITCRGNNRNGVLLFEFLSMCSFNKDSEFRVEGEPVFFERVDASDAEQRQLKEAAISSAAYSYAMNTPIEVLMKNLESRNIQPKGWNEPTVRLKAFELGKIKPFETAKEVKKEEPAPAKKSDSLAIAREAVEGNIIKYVKTKKFSGYQWDDGTEILKIHFAKPDKPQLLAEYLDAHPEILEQIKARL